jgi:hypothetical protein
MKKPALRIFPPKIDDVDGVRARLEEGGDDLDSQSRKLLIAPQLHAVGIDTENVSIPTAHLRGGRPARGAVSGSIVVHSALQ